MSNRLPVLAETANAHHDIAVASLRTAADSARIAGAALVEAKQLIAHGEWAGWLNANFRGGIRTAQRYMKIARNWHAIAGKNDSVSHLSVTQALALLDGGDEYERILKLGIEVDALLPEMDFLKKAIESADKRGLEYIISRVGEINAVLIDIKSNAIQEFERSCREDNGREIETGGRP